MTKVIFVESTGTEHEVAVGDGNACADCVTSEDLGNVVTNNNAALALLGQQISAETLAREGADTAINAAIAAKADPADIAGAVAVEASLRGDADLSINKRVDALEGLGGYVQQHDFGMAAPEQADITAYVKSMIWPDDADDHADTDIFNGTRVVNTFDNTVWVLANTPNTLPPVFVWEAAFTNASVSTASNETAGIVLGGATTPGAISITDGSGHMKANGLAEHLTDDVIHITAAEREAWNAGSNIGEGGNILLNSIGMYGSVGEFIVCHKDSIPGYALATNAELQLSSAAYPELAALYGHSTSPVVPRGGTVPYPWGLTTTMRAMHGTLNNLWGPIDNNVYGSTDGFHSDGDSGVRTITITHATGVKINTMTVYSRGSSEANRYPFIFSIQFFYADGTDEEVFRTDTEWGIAIASFKDIPFVQSAATVNKLVKKIVWTNPNTPAEYFCMNRWILNLREVASSFVVPAFTFSNMPPNGVTCIIAKPQSTLPNAFPSLDLSDHLLAVKDGKAGFVEVGALPGGSGDSGGGGVSWGDITGNLPDQTDLQAALESLKDDSDNNYAHIYEENLGKLASGANMADITLDVPALLRDLQAIAAAGNTASATVLARFETFQATVAEGGVISAKISLTNDYWSNVGQRPADETDTIIIPLITDGVVVRDSYMFSRYNSELYPVEGGEGHPQNLISQMGFAETTPTGGFIQHRSGVNPGRWYISTDIKQIMELNIGNFYVVPDTVWADAPEGTICGAIASLNNKIPNIDDLPIMNVVAANTSLTANYGASQYPFRQISLSGGVSGQPADGGTLIYVDHIRIQGPPTLIYQIAMMSNGLYQRVKTGATWSAWTKSVDNFSGLVAEITANPAGVATLVQILNGLSNRVTALGG